MSTTQQNQDEERQSVEQSSSLQGQRLKQPLSRRPPLPEQTARLGQQNSYDPPPNLYNKHAQRTNPSEARNRDEQETRYTQRRTHDQMLRGGDRERRQMVYHQRFQRSAQEPQYLGGGQEESKITGDYYETYTAMPPADVREDWEDDAESMHFGDWETEASYGIYAYSSTNREAPFIAPIPSQDANRAPERVPPLPQTRTTRNLAHPAERGPEPRSPLTRNSRERHVTQPAAPIPPAPQAPAQEAQRYQRNTQPLNPWAIARMNQDIPQEVPSHIHHSTSQGDMQNQTQAFYGPSTTSPDVCPKCKGAGFLRVKLPYWDPQFGKPITCECKDLERKEKRRQQLEEMSNLGAFHNKKFENFIPNVSNVVQRAYKEAYNYAQDPDGWLVLIGKTGCGKTHLAAAIANKRLTCGSPVLFTTVPELLDHLRATFMPTSTIVYDQLFSRMREAELLVLDDFGVQQSSPWANEKLFQLLNYRYNSRMPTIITTNNIGLQGIDERIRSRLTDASLVITVTFDGAQDHRPHNRQRE